MAVKNSEIDEYRSQILILKQQIIQNMSEIKSLRAKEEEDEGLVRKLNFKIEELKQDKV